MVTGCLRSGITIYRQGQPAVADPTGPVYPPARPALLERVTAKGMIGAAVLLEPGTAAALRGCLLAGNGAPGSDGGGNYADAPPPTFPVYPTVWARAGSNLEVVDSRFTANFDLSIMFEGERLSARRSLFEHNEDSGLKAQFQPPAPAMYVGRRPPALTTVHVSDCRFVNNTSKRGPGGAMCINAGAVVAMNDTLFKGNSANTGEGRVVCVCASVCVCVCVCDCARVCVV